MPMPPSLAVVCACRHGLIHHAEWADPCPVCKGRGSLTFAELCRTIAESPSTMRRLLKGGKTRGKTATRILDKLVELVERAQGRDARAA